MQHTNHAPLTFWRVLTGWQLCFFQSRLFLVGRRLRLCGGWLTSVSLVSRFLFWAGLALFAVSCLLRCRCWICTGGLMRGETNRTGQQQEEKEESGKRTERWVKRCPSLTEEPSEEDECGWSVMNHEKMDKAIKENRFKVMDSGRKKKRGLTSCSDSFLLSCSVVSLSSTMPKRDSVFSTIQKTTCLFFFCNKNFFWARTLPDSQRKKQTKKKQKDV